MLGKTGIFNSHTNENAYLYIFPPVSFLNLQKLIVLVYWDIKTCKQEEKHQFWCYTRS